MNSKYDRIGSEYNQTRKADPFLSSRLLFHLKPQSGKSYLDIGCGTGNYTIAIYEEGIQWTGIDPSTKMLEVARSRHDQIQWLQGSAEKTGLPSESMDGIVGFLTMHHWKDLKVAFLELARILKEDCPIVLFTSSPVQMEGYWLNHYFPVMLKDSIHQMPSLAILEEAMVDAGLHIEEKELYFVKEDLEDKFLYCGKNQPELYLDRSVRNGISSFSALANREEVEKGLLHLQMDIQAGKIHDIIRKFDHEKGDYVFLIGKKKKS